MVYIGERQRQQEIERAAREVGRKPSPEKIQEVARRYERYGVSESDIERRRGQIDEPKKHHISHHSEGITYYKTARGTITYRVGRSPAPVNAEEISRSEYVIRKKLFQKKEIPVIYNEKRTIIKEQKGHLMLKEPDEKYLWITVSEKPKFRELKRAEERVSFTGGRRIRKEERLRVSTAPVSTKPTTFMGVSTAPVSTKPTTFIEAVERPYGVYTRTKLAPGEIITIAEKLAKREPVIRKRLVEGVAVSELVALSPEEAKKEREKTWVNVYAEDIRRRVTGEPVVREFRELFGPVLLYGEQQRRNWQRYVKLREKYWNPTAEKITRKIEQVGQRLSRTPPYQYRIKNGKVTIKPYKETPLERIIKGYVEASYETWVKPLVEKPLERAALYAVIFKAFQWTDQAIKWAAPKVLSEPLAKAITSRSAGKIMTTAMLGTTGISAGTEEYIEEIEKGKTHEEALQSAIGAGTGAMTFPQLVIGAIKVGKQIFDVTFPEGYNKPVEFRGFRTVTTKTGEQYMIPKYELPADAKLVRKPIWEWKTMEKRLPKKVSIIETIAMQRTLDEGLIGTKITERAGYVRTKLLMEQFRFAKSGKIGELQPPTIQESVPIRYGPYIRITEGMISYPSVPSPSSKLFYETHSKRGYVYWRTYPKTRSIYEIISSKRKQISFAEFEMMGIIPKVEAISSKELSVKGLSGYSGFFQSRAYLGEKFKVGFEWFPIRIGKRFIKIPKIYFTEPKLGPLIRVRTGILSGRYGIYEKITVPAHERVHALDSYYKMFMGDTPTYPAYLRRKMGTELRAGTFFGRKKITPSYKELLTEYGYPAKELLSESFARAISEYYTIKPELFKKKYPYTTRAFESMIKPEILLEEYIGKKTFKVKKTVKVPPKFRSVAKIETIGVTKIKDITIPESMKIITEAKPITARKMRMIKEAYKDRLKVTKIKRIRIKKGEPWVGEELKRFETRMKLREASEPTVQKAPEPTVQKKLEQLGISKTKTDKVTGKVKIGYFLEPPSKIKMKIYPFVSPPTQVFPPTQSTKLALALHPPINPIHPPISKRRRPKVIPTFRIREPSESLFPSVVRLKQKPRQVRIQKLKIPPIPIFHIPSKPKIIREIEDDIRDIEISFPISIPQETISIRHIKIIRGHVPPYDPPPPHYIPPYIPPFIFGPIPSSLRRKKRRKIKRFRYLPSLEPVAKKWYGIKPKFLTGLEPRFL